MIWDLQGKTFPADVTTGLKLYKMAGDTPNTEVGSDDKLLSHTIRYKAGSANCGATSTEACTVEIIGINEAGKYYFLTDIGTAESPYKITVEFEVKNQSLNTPTVIVLYPDTYEVPASTTDPLGVNFKLNIYFYLIKIFIKSNKEYIE